MNSKIRLLQIFNLSSPPRLGRGPSSSGRLSGRRRPRPPPPPATASFPVAAATAGAHAGPALRSPKSETGKGGAAAAGSPAPVARRPPPLRRCPSAPGVTGPACGARRSRGRRRRPRVQRPSGEAKRKSARRLMASARAGGGLRRGGVRERAEGAVSMLPRRRVGLYRLLQSPRAERHHLGKNADLAAAAQAGRTGWAGRVSRQAARTAWPGEGSCLDAGARGVAGARAGGHRALLRPNRRLRPPPACRPRSAKAAGKGKWLSGCSSQSYRGRSPSLQRGERAGPLSSPCGLFPDRKQAVHLGHPLEPSGVLESPVGYLTRERARSWTFPILLGNRFRNFAKRFW